MKNNQTKEEKLESVKIDKPIEKKEKDLFDRSSVAKQLNTIIKNYKEEDSIAFGIIGDWGSGKTSFINMALEDFKNDENFIIVKFNPWNISTRKQLISDFFTILAKEIRNAPFPKLKIENFKKIYSHIKIKFLSRAPNGLEELSLLFKISSYVIADPVISAAMSKTSSIINDFNKLLSIEKKGLDEIKNEINTALSNIDTKIIIVIDDLDRLVDTDIQEIFQLVRSIADFKNTIYILSYDEEIVSKALDKVQKDKGGKYIERIVQVPIKLPKISQENLRDVFVKKLEAIHIKYETLDKNEFIQEIKDNNFADAFKNIRDMERFLNTFKIEVNAINQELHLYDFAVITLLKVFEPRFYDYIYENYENFFSIILTTGEKNKAETLKNIIDAQMNKITKLNKQEVLELIKTIFPKIKELYDNRQLEFSNHTKKKRIAAVEYFHCYFVLNFPNNEFSKELLEKIVNANSIENYKDIFKGNKINNLQGLNDLFFKNNLEFFYKIKHREQFLLYLFSIFDELEEDLSKKYKTYYQYFRFLASDEEIVDEAIKDDKYPLEVRILYVFQINSQYSKETFYKEEIKELIKKLRNKHKEKAYYIMQDFLDCSSQDLIQRKTFIEKYIENPDILFLFLEALIEEKDDKQLYIDPSYIARYFISCQDLLRAINNIFQNPTREEERVINIYKKALSSYENSKKSN